MWDRFAFYFMDCVMSLVMLSSMLRLKLVLAFLSSSTQSHLWFFLWLLSWIELGLKWFSSAVCMIGDICWAEFLFIEILSCFLQCLQHNSLSLLLTFSSAARIYSSCCDTAAECYFSIGSTDFVSWPKIIDSWRIPLSEGFLLNWKSSFVCTSLFLSF